MIVTNETFRDLYQYLYGHRYPSSNIPTEATYIGDNPDIKITAFTPLICWARLSAVSVRVGLVVGRTFKENATAGEIQKATGWRYSTLTKEQRGLRDKFGLTDTGLSLKAIREQLDMTPTEVANTIGIAPSTYRNYEEGKSQLDHNARLILELLLQKERE
jgi:DNA-binding transcriptional regulator YiaG